MTSPPHRALQEALRVLAEAVTDRRWEMAVDAGVAARAALHAVEWPAEFWFGSDAVCARRCLDAGAYSRSIFTMFAQAAVQSGREAELAELSAAIAARHPSRRALMAEIVERVRRPTSSWPPPSTPQVLRAPAPVVAEALGTFEIDSGLLTVGDPGYTDDCLRFHVPIVGAKTGTWRGTVLRANVPGRGERCAMLIAEHDSHSCSVDDAVWVPQGRLDVEYAAAGIFDSTRYYDGVVDADPIAEALHPSMLDEHPWYVACVRRSHGVGDAHDGRGAGVLPFGCVSASGLGDGDYQCYAVRASDGAIVGVCIDFDLRAVKDDASR